VIKANMTGNKKQETRAWNQVPRDRIKV